MTQNPVVENIVETAKHAQANQTRLWPYGLIFGLLIGGLADWRPCRRPFEQMVGRSALRFTELTRDFLLLAALGNTIPANRLSAI